VETITIRRVDGEVVCARCRLAESIWARTRGLLGWAGLEADEGMLIRPAGSVHTLFMRFPIDVVFLDRELAVLSVRDAVPPWRVVAQRGAKATLELPPGAAARAGLEPGRQLREDRPATPSGSAGA
jgi:uncharacterized membrane protein (UPF0127 family)